MNIIYKEGKENTDYSQVRTFLEAQASVKKSFDEEAVKSLIGNSTYVLGAYDDEKLVAFIRVLSDEYEWTLISDYGIFPEYENQGIGETLINKVTDRFKGHEIFAYTSPETISVFEGQGFFRSKNAFTYSGTDDSELDDSISNSTYFLPLGYRYENEFYPVVGDFPQGIKSKATISAEDVKYTDSAINVDYNRVNEILSVAFGGHERDINVTRGAFENSQYYEFAFDKDKLIGCARAVSDCKTQGFILNVAIDPGYQGIHLGWNIVTKLAEQMKGQNIFLNTHPGGVGFYNRRGFRRNKTALLYPAHPDMPPEIAKGFILPAGYRFVDETL